MATEYQNMRKVRRLSFIVLVSGILAVGVFAPVVADSFVHYIQK